MKKYYIYHIKGKKIGCTTEPLQRTKKQGYTEYEILETHTDIYLASNREIDLQKQYGYEIDTVPYYVTYNLNSKRREKLTTELKKIAGRKGGIKNKISGNIYKAQKRSIEVRTGTKHTEETKIKIRKSALGRKQTYRKKVLVYDKNTMNFIGEFDNQSQVCKKLNLSVGNVSNVVNGKYEHTCGYIIKNKE